jgi:hypothetical protein
MAKIHIERAYIEPFDGEEEDFSILIHVKRDNDHIFAGKVDLDRQIPWIYLDFSKNGDLEINNSAGMEDNKWDHITKYILGESNE